MIGVSMCPTVPYGTARRKRRAGVSFGYCMNRPTAGTMEGVPSGPRTKPGTLELRAVAIIGDELDSRGRTIQWLADEIDVSRPLLSRILSGQKPVTLSEVERMCAALGIDMLDVIRRASA